MLGIKTESMKPTILVIEDNPDSREMLVDALEFAGYAVLEAGDGEEGERKAKAEKPHVILLDISLPVKAGWDVARDLRRDEATRNIPIIALTAHTGREDRDRVLEAGCDSYLPKPVKPRDVIQEIEKYLTQSGGTPSSDGNE
jgi:CheY-like chemotaxis protein